MTALCLSIMFALADGPVDPHADEFAKAVQKIHEVIRRKSIVQPSPRQLAELSLRGLFKGQGKSLPDDLAKRLKDEKGTDAELRSILRDGFRRAESRELGVEEAVGDAITFTLAALDPHASWQPSEGFECDLGNYSGLGLKWQFDGKTGLPCVVTPFKDGPAYRAGLRAGDLLTHITRMPSETSPNNADVPDRVALAGAARPQWTGCSEEKLAVI